MENQTYNGWANYETWRISLEFFNDYHVEQGDFKDESELAEHLKSIVEESIDQHGDNIATLYAHAFVNSVDYNEIAEFMLKHRLISTS